MIVIPLALGAVGLIAYLLMRKPAPPDVARATTDLQNGTATADQLASAADSADLASQPEKAKPLRRAAASVAARQGDPVKAMRIARTALKREAVARAAKAYPTGTTDRGAVPRPATKPPPLGQVTTIAQAILYAEQGYHASLDAADSKTGVDHDAWLSAARAYESAYRTIIKLPPPSVADAKYALTGADRIADEAAGVPVVRSTEGLSGPSRSLVPRPSEGPVKVDFIATIAQARTFAQTGFHVSLDQVGLTSGAKRDRWINAANLYVAAYNLTGEGASLDGVLATIRAANAVATQARAM